MLEWWCVCVCGGGGGQGTGRGAKYMKEQVCHKTVPLHALDTLLDTYHSSLTNLSWHMQVHTRTHAYTSHTQT